MWGSLGDVHSDHPTRARWVPTIDSLGPRASLRGANKPVETTAFRACCRATLPPRAFAGLEGGMVRAGRQGGL
jgi:hypothetical protein